jgi:hypothetical protein
MQQYRNSETHYSMRSFRYLIQSTLSLALLFVLTALPLAPLFASEVPSGEEDFQFPSEDESVPEVAEEVATIDLVESAAEDTDVEVPTDAVVTDDLGTDTQNEDILETIPSTDDAGTSTSDSSSIPVDADSGTENDEADVVDVEDLPEDPVVEVSDASGESDEDDASLNASTTTESVEPDPDAVAVHTVTNDANRYSFSDNECVVVGDGSFYCAKSEPVSDVTQTDRIFAASDQSGDKEIFIEKDGTVIAFTDNAVDDDAPYYDETSDAIVWHRLIDGRYQIVSRVLDAAAEELLTQTSYNNMEPSRYGDAIVWQAWIQNGWEIMLYDDGTTVQITNNDIPDIAPDINAQYIVWQSQEDGVWNAKVYDRITGDIETIADTEGMGVENARFVLVYDTLYENGDIETRGYDPRTKQSVPLGARPAPMPTKLPEPEQTGEDRALVQSLIQIKPKVGEEEPLAPDEPPTDDTASSTDDSPADLVVEPVNDDVPLFTEGETESGNSQVPDLVIELQHSPDTLETSHIEDLVVTPFVAHTDSQEGIARDE